MYAIIWSETRSAGVVAALMEGKLPAMTVLTVILSVCTALLAPAQFIATKQGKEAQTRPAEYLAAQAIMSKGQFSFEAQCLLPCLTKQTAASAHKADQSMQHQSSSNIMAPKHLWGKWAKADLPQPLCIFKNVLLMSMASCRPVYTISHFVCMSCKLPGWALSTAVWHPERLSYSRGHVARLW